MQDSTASTPATVANAGHQRRETIVGKAIAAKEFKRRSGRAIFQRTAFLPLGLIVPLATVGCALPLSSAMAQIIVSANDGKQVRSGDPVPGPFPDEVVTLSLDRAGRPRVVGRVEAPATLNGPPVSIAVAPNGRFALVASAQRFGAGNKLQPYGIVSMIDLTAPARPRVVRSLEVAPGAMGVWMTRDTKLALVASASDDSVAVLSVTPGRDMKLIDTIRLEPKAEPRDVVIAPDNRTAYVVRFGDGKITKLAIDGMKVARAGDIVAGTNPDGAIITRDGRYLYNTNFGGTALSGKVGAISTVDLRTDRMVAAITVGETPEHVALSADGRFLVSVVGNGSAFTRDAPNFAEKIGRLRVYKAGGPDLIQIAEANIGHNCQGATFSDDSRTVLVQCAVEKTITAFHFDGQTLVPVENGTLTFDARPGAIATPRSR
jgi:6-phosphogluconolactonase (cycloisomerase 2 family)